MGKTIIAIMGFFNLIFNLVQLKDVVINWGYWRKREQCEMKELVKYVLINNLLDAMIGITCAVALILYWALSLR